MIELLQKNMARFVGEPSFGRQHLGHVPGGALDRFSMRSGNVLLGRSMDERALEFGPHAPKIRFRRPGLFVLVGAHRDAMLNGQAVPHTTVVAAEANDRLTFGKVHYGRWSYLSCCDKIDAGKVGWQRGSFRAVATWPDASGRLRVLPGPDATDEQFVDLISATWQIDRQSSDMGLRLIGPSLVGETSMISQPVVDGTVQLTPRGPIVLMRRRPTVGGYPRLGVVIDADLDLLAQHQPGQAVRFNCVTHEQAAAIRKQQADDLEAIKLRAAGPG